MNETAEWYQDKLGFKRFWTADDKDIATDYTSLRSVVVAMKMNGLKCQSTVLLPDYVNPRSRNLLTIIPGPGSSISPWIQKTL